MKSTWNILGAGALALALTACGPQRDDFTDATPDVAGLSLELAGGAPEGLAAGPGAVTARLAAVAPSPGPADELGDARESLRALNAEVKRVLEQVAAVAQQAPSAELGDVKVYGPAVRCVQADGAGGCLAQASLRLAVRHHELRVYSWVLEARAAGSASADDFKPVLAGWMARNAEAHRGRGRAVFNLENLRAAAPGYTGRGYLLAGFGHAGGAVALRYKLVGFTPDPAVHDPVTAGFAGHRTAAGVSRVRVATFKDAVDGANVDFPREVVLGHLGWKAGLGGRGYLLVSNWTDAAGNLHGDVPSVLTGTDHYYFGRGCWGAGGELKVKEWRFCARGLGPAACLLTTPVATEPADATWAGRCTGFAAEEPLPADVSAGAEQGTQGEPPQGGDALPTPEAPPAGPADTAPPAGT